MTSPISSILEARAQRERQAADAKALQVVITNTRKTMLHLYAQAGIGTCGATQPMKNEHERREKAALADAFSRVVDRLMAGSGEK